MHKIALVLGIVAIAEGAVTLHLVNQLHDSRENAQTLQVRVTELERSRPQPAAGATFVAVPTGPAVSPFTTGAGSSAQTSRPPPSAAVTGAFGSANAFVAGVAVPPPDPERMRQQMNASMDRQRALLRDPEYREAMLMQQKMALMRSNPSAVKDLDLSPEQADRLFDTMAQQALRSMENSNRMAWGEQPDPAQLQEFQRKAMEQQNADEAELKAALGESKYREWKEYQGMAGVRWEADRVRASLANAGVPLDDALTKSLLTTLQDQQQKVMQQQMNALPGASMRARLAIAGQVANVDAANIVQTQQDSLDSMAKYQRQRREALAGVLTPEQLKIIEDEHNAEVQMQRAQLRILRAQQEAGGLDPAQNIGFFREGVAVAPAASN
jgi:hypothetical protein